MWTPAFPLSALPEGGARLFKSPLGGIAVFRTAEGTVRAVDNRCPHEGYPLVTGYVRGETLTCAWHNFKFDLCSGACLQGDEAVRAWPVRVRDGQVEVDLTPPDLSAERPARLASLASALSERRLGQLARDVVRLLEIGVTPREIAIFGARWDGDRGEYGPSHAMAALVDAVAWADAGHGLERALPLALALEVASDTQVRRPLRARPAPVTDPDPARALRAAVEAEDAPRAEGLVRGALAAGAAPTEVLGWIDACLADHFLDFGHARIYQEKLHELLAWGVATDDVDALLGAHVYGIVNGTREDTLPPWSAWARRLAPLDPAALDARPRPGRLERDALVEASPRQALERVLDGDAPVAALIDALSVAAAERLFRFDPAWDADPRVQDDWLTVTHRLTFVQAVRAALPRLTGADRWRTLAQAAWFVARARAVDGPRPTVEPRAGDADALLAAVRAGDAAAAVGITAGLWARGGAAAAARSALARVPLEHPGTRPIVVAHAMKTLVAAAREAEALDDPLPLLAVARWYASPMVEQRAPQRVYEAIRLQVEGKPPERVADG